MTFLALILTLVALGLFAWLLSFLPLGADIHKVLHVVFLVAAVLLVLEFFFGLTIGEGTRTTSSGGCET